MVQKDATGAITECNYGNGINTKRTYDNFHNLIEIDHGSGGIFKQTYDYNTLTGNLNYKVFENFITSISLKDVFSFDNLDRLKQSKQVDVVNNNQLQVNNLNYDVLGNITSKSDAGSPVCTNLNKPFSITSINGATGNVKVLNVSNNDFNMVSQLNEVGTNKQMDFVYGVGNQRIKMAYSNGSGNIYTRYYAQNYDLEETSSGFKDWTYIMAPTGLCAINFNDNGNPEFDYVLTDHLGSPVLLTDNTQGILEEYSFDSWGRRRNPTNWTYSSIPAPTKMIRGYTLHEHMEELGMINMNARIYDPVLGSFLQTDDRVTDENNIQTYNKYAYCRNNPLKYTDPTGHDSDPSSFNANSYFSYLNFSTTNNPYGYQMYDPTRDINASYNSAYESNNQQWAMTEQNITTSSQLCSEILKNWGNNAAESNSYMNGLLGEANEMIEARFDAGWTGGGAGLDGFETVTIASPHGAVTIASTGGAVTMGRYTITSAELRTRLDQFAATSGQNITVTGGDRSTARNRQVGGARASRHITGDAADVAVRGMTNLQLANLANQSGLFNTVIYYPQVNMRGALDPHVHVDLNPGHADTYLIYTPYLNNKGKIVNSYSPMTGH